MKSLWEQFLLSGITVDCLMGQPSVAAILSNMVESDVIQLRDHLDGLRESVDSFSKHAARNEHASRYAARWQRMYEVFLSHPSIDLLEKLQRYAKHAEIVHSGMRRGNWHDSMLQRLLADSRASLRFLGSTLEEEVETGDQHKEFVRNFERDFKVKAARHEGVSNGVYIYLDAEATHKVNEQLQTAQDFLEKIADKHGYICIRRGQPHDIDYGPLSEKLSKWVFVHSPATKEKDIKKLGKTQVYGDDELSPTRPKDFDGE